MIYTLLTNKAMRLAYAAHQGQRRTKAASRIFSTLTTWRSK